MSDPREVPPTPGTGRIEEEPRRRYREDAGIYARHRAAGTSPLTDSEVDARLRAHAEDLAADDDAGPAVPFLDELVQTFRHRVFRGNEVRSKAIASYEEDRRMASIRSVLASERRNRALRRVRELASVRKRMRPPVTGLTLTGPEAFLYCLVPGVAIEVFGSAPSLDAAFGLGKELSWLCAAAVSGAMILAADMVGDSIAAASMHSRRRTGIVAGLLAVTAIGACIWAVVGLADSRAHNVAYQEASNLAPTTDADGSFGAADPKGGTATAAEAAPAKEGPTMPEYGFFIPLSVVILATATLVAFRIELAREWHEVSEAMDEFEERAEEAGDEDEEARTALQRAVTPDHEAALDVVALVEREHALLSLWLTRFVAEYHRFRTAAGKRPRTLSMPAVPNPDAIVERILYPRDGHGQGGGGDDGPGGGHTPPPAGAEGGEAGQNGNGAGPGPEPPPPPPLSGERPGSEPWRDDGSPKGFGG